MQLKLAPGAAPSSLHLVYLTTFHKQRSPLVLQFARAIPSLLVGLHPNSPMSTSMPRLYPFKVTIMGTIQCRISTTPWSRPCPHPRPPLTPAPILVMSFPPRWSKPSRNLRLSQRLLLPLIHHHPPVSIHLLSKVQPFPLLLSVKRPNVKPGAKPLSFISRHPPLVLQLKWRR